MEAAWPCGLGAVLVIGGGPGFKSRSDHLDLLFTVAPFLNPRTRFINSQLVCLTPVGIYSVLSKGNSAKYFDT